MTEYLDHPYIRPRTIQARIYQQILFGTAIKENTLIVLPTGLGKTVIFMMVIAHYLKNFPGQAVIITAPTRPLVNQHLESAKQFLNIDLSDIHILSGEVSPSERSNLWQNGSVFICTPQTLRNDIISKRLDLSNISLLCFDEAHRAIGDDPYVLCAQEYSKIKRDGRRLGFTASPGNKSKIYEILDNLRLNQFEYMDEDHPQVKPYVHDVDENWIWVELPEEFQQIIDLLEGLTKHYLQYLKDIGIVRSIVISNNPKSKLLEIPRKLNSIRDQLEDNQFFGGMASYGQLMLLYQASEMLETQGVHTLHKYLLDKLDEFRRTHKSSLRRFTQHPDIQQVIQLTEGLLHNGIFHPKLEKLQTIIDDQISSHPQSRILVFANYKATTQFLVDQLSENSQLSVHRFVGQSSSSYGKGLSQKEQKRVMDSFRSGIYNVLVSTSVGEEGLDVAQCDLVIFYDVTPSATRLIQRSGRTGRAREGEVVILITRGTRDEGYFYAARYQKQKIRNSIKEIKSELSKSKEQKKQTSLDAFLTDDKETASEGEVATTQSKEIDFSPGNNPIIYIDHRERGSSIVRELLNEPIELRQESLPVGDFLLSDRVAVERKTGQDFTTTLMRGDLFDQLIELKQTFQKPLLLLEGTISSSMSPAAIQGAIASVMVDYNIPIIRTQNERETIDMLVTIARREQREKQHTPVIRGSSSTETLFDEQLSLLAALPNINNVLAERILREFKTPRQFFNASIDDMRKVHGIGTQIASRLDQLLSTPDDEMPE